MARAMQASAAAAARFLALALLGALLLAGQPCDAGSLLEGLGLKKFEKSPDRAWSPGNGSSGADSARAAEEAGRRQLQRNIDHDNRVQAAYVKPIQDSVIRAVPGAIAAMDPAPAAAPTAPAGAFPVGSRMFGLAGRVEYVNLNQPTGYSQGTPIASENLVRAASILRVLKDRGVEELGGQSGELGPEDVKFLADQAGLAMEGAPLQVIVAGSPGRATARAMAEVPRAVATVVDAQRRVTELTVQRLNLQMPRREAARRAAADPQQRARLKEILDTYDQTARGERAERVQLRDAQKALRQAVMCGPAATTPCD